MAMVCPQCKQTFEHSLQCPQCQVRLGYQTAGLGTLAIPVAVAADEAPGEWQHTPWGKILVGLILTQGLCYGLQQLLLAGAGATGEEPTDAVWQTLGGLVLLHMIQALSLLVGGALSGAGQPRGVINGCLVGLGNGLITLLVQRQQHDLYPDVVVYLQPPLHLALGALGGLFGTFIWCPSPHVPMLAPSDVPPAAAPDEDSLFSRRLFAGPLHLGRVCAGSFVVVLGVVWSSAILQFVLHASQGTLSVSSHLQAQLVGWEISALAALVGSALAGATTGNGLKQGLCVGLGAGVVLVGIHLSGGRTAVETIAMAGLCLIVLTGVGGWFGGQLFPPIVEGRRRRWSSFN